MATLVGTQNDFKQALIALLELEYDAIGAYKIAVEKLKNLEFKRKLSEFLNEHEQHVVRIKAYYQEYKADFPNSPDLLKGMLAKMKVVVGSFIGSDITILKAMLDNELDTNTAYERMINHPERPAEFSEILENAYRDEQKHKQWIEQTINQHK